MKMEWLLLDSGDTKSQTDHSELMVFVFLFVVIKHMYDTTDNLHVLQGENL